MKEKNGLQKTLAVFLVAVLLLTTAPLAGFVGLDFGAFDLFSTTAQAASTYTEVSFTYTVADGKATITGHNGEISGELVIPETLGGYPVTNIGSSAFSGCTGLTSITISDSVTSIGYYAFSGCTGLTKINWNAENVSNFSYNNYIFSNAGTAGAGIDVVFGDSVKSIPAYLFYNSSSSSYITPNIKSVTISDSVTSIGSSAFDNTAWYNAQPFGDVYAGKVYYKYKGTMPENTSVEIKDGTKGIAGSAFSGCTGLTSVTIGNSVTSIGGSAFEDCTGLTSITIPDSVTSIGDYAFESCTGLTSVTIGNSVTRIGSYAFRNCTGLTSVTIPDSVTSIGNSAFSGCTGLTSVTIGDSVTSIGDHAFRNCTGLTSVIIPDSVTSIGGFAFEDCTGLTSITIPDSVTSIGSSAFDNTAWYNAQPFGDVYAGKVYYEYKGTMPENTSVEIKDGTKGIAGSAFSGCNGLVDINIPNGVTNIGDHAFYRCNELTDINIPDSVTSIGSYAFSSCTGLTSVIIPDSVTSIGDYAFSGCTGLTSVIIPDSVTSIGDYAFSDCRSLTSITIGNSVTSIGDYAFEYCTGLTKINWNAENVSDFSDYNDVFSNAGTAGDGIDVVFGDSVKSIPEYAFCPEYNDNQPNIKSVTIGNSVTSIGSYAFYKCRGLTSVTIPDSVTSIGDYAFKYCTGLTKINWNAENVSDFSYNNYIFSNGGTAGDGIDVVFGDSVKSIPAYLFYNSSSSSYITPNIKSVTISDSVTSIGWYAFRNCTGLTSITIGNSVTSIGGYAFSGCTGLTSITIPDSVTSIGKSAFSRCTGLTSITIPDGVTSIGSSAFSGCTGLTKIKWNAENVSDFSRSANVFLNAGTAGDGIDVVFGDSVKSIPKYAFCPEYNNNQPNIKSVTIGNSVTSIGDYAFEYCTGLTKINWNAENVSDFYSYNYVFSNAGTAGDGIDVVFGDSVKSIPKYAFFTEYDYNQPNIKSVTIGNSVTSIGDYAFRNCTGLTSITIPDSVTSIGGSAFYGCTGLTSVTIGNSVTSIGYSAFYGCTGLTSVTIGNSVTSIGYSAFYGCTGLTKINWNAENVSDFSYNNYIFSNAGTAGAGIDVVFGDSVKSIPAYLFYNSSSSSYITPKIKSVTIGNSVTSIGDYAFRNCTGLTSVTIPDSVTSIGGSSFSGCTGLTSITIPDSVTSIGSSTFYGCTGLTSVTIGNSVTSIGDYSFRNCTGLTKINWNAENVSDFYSYNYIFSNAGTTGDGIDVVFGDSVKSIPEYAFCPEYNDNQPNIKSVTIGNSVTRIGRSAFSGCTGLTSITIPDSVTSIGSSAFDNTAWYNAQPFGDVYAGKVYYKYKGTMLENTSVEIKDGTKGIAGSAFSGCNGLVDINIPNGVTNIGDGAFYSCNELTDINIPDSVTSIGSSAFSYCTGLTSVTIGNSVTSIGSSAFSGCNRLTSITIPDSVTSIGSSAFRNCTGLTSAIIPDSVTSIGSSAFSDCWDLKSITIGDSVTSIGDYAFESCSDLTSITIPDSVTSIGGSAFYGCTRLTSATIGNGVETILTGTFQKCPGLTTIKIKKGVNVIEENAFYGIKSIPDVFFEGSEEEWKAISIDQSNDMILRANMYYNSNLTHEHSYTETVKEATCTEDGLKTFTCECGKSYTEKIKSPGHRFEIVVVEPTCISIGYVTNTCKNCGESYFVKTLPATGHDESEWIIDKNADCKNAGSKHKECTVCKELIKTEIIPMTSHSFISSIVEPTCISLGYETRTCENCGECQFVRVLPATGHKEVLVSGKPATCTETGLTEGKKCSFCGEILVKQEEILALGHTDENNDGKCDRCGEKIDDPVTPPQSDPPANCSCACHKGGIANLFFKIGLLFQKIFRKNKICMCGAMHY